MSLRDVALVASMVRNIRTKAMNRDMRGHTIVRTFGPVTQEDIFAYVQATRDDPSRYRDGQCRVPPFYISRLLYPMFRYFLVNRDLHLNILRLVHGHQGVTWLNPICVGDVLNVSMSVGEITDTPAGEFINLRTVVSVREQPAVIGDTGFIVRGTGSRTGEKKQGEVPGREVFRSSFTTVKGQQMDYARVSGDKNFIHTSTLLAKASGLPGTILHGVCIAAMAANTLLDETLQGNMDRMKKISMRFARPVLPGEEITVIGYESPGNGEIFFDAVNGRGRQVVKNGIFQFSQEQ